jgi:hypothetical protein
MMARKRTSQRRRSLAEEEGTTPESRIIVIRLGPLLPSVPGPPIRSFPSTTIPKSVPIPDVTIVGASARVFAVPLLPSPYTNGKIEIDMAMMMQPLDSSLMPS